MAVAEGKVRKQITFEPEDFEYLKFRAAELGVKGNITPSTVIKFLIDNDRVIRNTFGDQGKRK